MSTNPSQLFLLADHIKLSLLERQRAITLNLEPNKQDSHISRSLESLREGIEALEAQGADNNITSRLRSQLTDLSSQLHGFPQATPQASTTLTHPNNPSLEPDFAAAQSSRPRNPAHSLLKTNRTANTNSPTPKSVRFRDSSPDAAHAASRAALFPYKDDPASSDASLPDHADLDNQQIHAYHSRVMAEQDEQLDALGESIGRQRELSIQIGDELDGHVQLLDEVDEGVDRHQGQLDRAKRRLEGVARKARDNMQLTIIAILIIILVLLIIILK
ncbi:hypothetical protein B0A49_02030 [Cryomyces minteri]|uniref:t-SNARE coiled-coil homology domain-containing protein n=1 Tax=Cryomyces minteri TaxID=331657 RepID=A0A4U0XDF8_9PEZI|nr:hypothetical protein B0A49_02030 [Cryomyces minteri]